MQKTGLTLKKFLREEGERRKKRPGNESRKLGRSAPTCECVAWGPHATRPYHLHRPSIAQSPNATRFLGNALLAAALSASLEAGGPVDKLVSMCSAFCVQGLKFLYYLGPSPKERARGH